MPPRAPLTRFADAGSYLEAMEHFVVRDGRITNDMLVFDGYEVREAH